MFVAVRNRVLHLVQLNIAIIDQIKVKDYLYIYEWHVSNVQNCEYSNLFQKFLILSYATTKTLQGSYSLNEKHYTQFSQSFLGINSKFNITFLALE